MKAIILVGGLGTRLRPLTWNTPKSLVPVLNRPFLEYVLTHLKKHGVDEVILAISNLASSIQEYFGNGHKLGINIEYTFEESALGTAGAIKNAASKLAHDRFFVLNGDIFSDLDYSTMLKFHIQNHSSATIALTPVDNPTAYGLVETGDTGRLTRFLEKPKPEEVTTNLINAGTYILEPSVLNLIPPDTPYSTEHQLFPSMLADKGNLYAFPLLGYWIDIGSSEKYQQINFDLLSGKSGQHGFLNGNEIIIGQNCQIHPTAKLEGPVLLGDNCIVEAGAFIQGPTVIGSHCRIDETSVISNSIIWQRGTFERNCHFTSSIAAEDCKLQSGSEAECAVIGNNVTILQNYKLASGSKIEPNQIIG